MHCVRITVNIPTQVLPLLDTNGETMKIQGTITVVYLGDENGIDLGVVFEIL